MKGLALETIIGLIIAIVGVMVFLILIGYLKISSNWFYCNIYWKIKSFFLSKETGSIPEVCKGYSTASLKIERINEGDRKIFSRILLSYIIACWKESEIRGLYKSHPCYELHLLKEVDNVDEESVSEILLNEDHCSSIENSDFGCGEKNQIIWLVENNFIRNQKIILIEYNGDLDAILVIG